MNRNSELKQELASFLQDDAKSVQEYNNLVSWSGNSIERWVSIISWRLNNALHFLIFLAGEVTKMQPRVVRRKRYSSMGAGSRRK